MTLKHRLLNGDITEEIYDHLYLTVYNTKDWIGLYNTGLFIYKTEHLIGLCNTDLIYKTEHHIGLCNEIDPIIYNTELLIGFM